MMRRLLYSLFILMFTGALAAQQPQAHAYHINLEIVKSQRRIAGSCSLQLLAASAFRDTVRLDLLNMQVDSLVVRDTLAAFAYDGRYLKFIASLGGSRDTVPVTVFYSGSPVRDATWGGFYFDGAYAWNMGVAFTSEPHPFGRCWFPCFDVFDDKASYRFSITTDSTDKAYCNGTLIGSENPGMGKRIWHWEHKQPIPTYLASVAVAPYAAIEGTLQGQQGGIPYILTALPADTANMRRSFANLQLAFDAFEAAYGKHRFDRVGFNTVPFNAGAMEHSTNIAYPRYAVNGNLQHETLMAHELSHHWWGNNVTCRKPEDMWLNEGWASYSEKLFLEKVYGTKAYYEAMKQHHADVLRLAHVQDGIPLPVCGIGHDHTYGGHVYKKGASMVHTLRWWMGDKNWRDACIRLQDSFRFGNISTDTMQSLFGQYSFFGLAPFFNQWVKMGGFPSLKIARMETRFREGTHFATVLLVQQSRFNYHTYTDFPVRIRWFSNDGRTLTTLHTVRQAVQEVESPGLNFEPVYAELDPNDQLSLARTHSLLRIMDSSIGLPYEYATITCRGAADTITVDVDHQWVGASTTHGVADRARPSDYRHWIVRGTWPGKASIDISFEYDGRKSNIRTGYLDHTIIPGTEDSLVLMYRTDHFQPWKRLPNAEFTMGNRFDRTGTVLVRNAMPGEYALGNSDPLLTGAALTTNPLALKAFPNPVEKKVTLAWEAAVGCSKELILYDSRGKEIGRERVDADRDRHTLNLEQFPAGMYVIELSSPCIEGHMQTMIVKGE
jgi:hypothetical protein